MPRDEKASDFISSTPQDRLGAQLASLKEHRALTLSQQALNLPVPPPLNSNGSHKADADYETLAAQWAEMNSHLSHTKHGLSEMLENVKNTQQLLDRWLQIYENVLHP